MKNALSLADPHSQHALLQLANQGLVDMSNLREVHRAFREENRHIVRPDETIQENIKTTVEVYYFR
jgi:hypothetical protein